MAAVAAALLFAAWGWGNRHAVVVYLVSNDAPDSSHALCNANFGCGPVVTAPITLRNGKRYLIRVSGTISVWHFWAPDPCGKPEPAPEFPTGPTTPTGDDAQFRFAINNPGPNGCAPTPVKTNFFQINLGSGWFHPIALGDPSTPSRDRHHSQHPYYFSVTGEGVQPMFRFIDFHSSDNDGKFQIVIAR